MCCYGGAVIDFICSVNGMIYCDLFAPQFVGEDKVWVIHSIIVWPATGIHLYQDIYYFPVEKSFKIFVLRLKNWTVSLQNFKILTYL